MKKLLIIFFIVSIWTLHAQSLEYSGNYEKKYEMTNGDFQNYKMVLKSDKTFVFQSHSFIAKGIPQERNILGRGTWSVEKNIISFTTDTINDLNKTYTLDLTNTKAKYLTKSSRDKSDRIIPTHLIFSKSDIPWVKGKKLPLVEL